MPLTCCFIKPFKMYKRSNSISVARWHAAVTHQTRRMEVGYLSKQHTPAAVRMLSHAYTHTVTHTQHGLLTPEFILAGKSMYVISCSSNIWSTVKSEQWSSVSWDRQSTAVTVHLHSLITHLTNQPMGKDTNALPTTLALGNRWL